MREAPPDRGVRGVLPPALIIAPGACTVFAVISFRRRLKVSDAKKVVLNV